MKALPKGMILLFVILAAAVHNGVALDAGTGQEISIKDEWISMSTPHFIVYSNENEKALRRIATKLEQFRESFLLTVQVRTVHTPVPTHIYVFKSQKTLESFLPYHDGEPVNFIGYFLPRVDGNYAAISIERGDYSVIFHEYAHFLLNNNAHHMPLWIHEGIAEYFSTFDYDNGECKIGVPEMRNVIILRNETMGNWHDFFATDALSNQYRTPDAQASYYARSWLLMHFLFHGRNATLRDKIGSLLQDLEKGEKAEVALARATGTEWEALCQELQDYVRLFTLKFSLVETGEIEAESFMIIKMSQEQILTRFGHLLAHLGEERRMDAEAYFNAALKIHPQSGESLAGLGFLKWQQNKLDEAVPLCQKGAEYAPDQAWPQFIYGSCLVEEAENSRKGSGESDSLYIQKQLKARAAFQRAIELNPDFAEPYAGYGRTFLARIPGPRQSGIRALEQALIRLPARMDIARNLTYLYAKNGDTTRVDQMINLLGVRLGESQLTKARSQAAHYLLNNATDAVKNDDFDKAYKLLRTAKRLSQEAEISNRVTEISGYLDRKVQMKN